MEISKKKEEEKHTNDEIYQSEMEKKNTHKWRNKIRINKGNNSQRENQKPFHCKL